MSPESAPQTSEAQAPAANPNLDQALNNLGYGDQNSSVEDAAVRPEGYPVITNPAELAQRQANTDAALREQRVADGKAPFVMPH